MSKKYAISAFVLSLLFFVPLAPLAGFVVGLIALHDHDRWHNFAMAAVVVGAVMTVLQLTFAMST